MCYVSPFTETVPDHYVLLARNRGKRKKNQMYECVSFIIILSCSHRAQSKRRMCLVIFARAKIRNRQILRFGSHKLWIADLRKHGVTSHNVATVSCHVTAILVFLRNAEEEGEDKMLWRIDGGDQQEVSCGWSKGFYDQRFCCWFRHAILQESGNT